MKLKKKYKIHIAAAFLVLFVLSIVPKYVYHNIFSNHNHEIASNDIKDLSTESTIDIKVDCDCEDLFTEIVFANDIVNYDFTFNCFTSLNSNQATSFITTTSFEANLRGPPAC